MPTYAPAPLRNFIEPTTRKYLEGDASNADTQARAPPSRHVYISPALYTTPTAAPFPEYSSPEPALPSPYVLNQKLRRGGVEKFGGAVSRVPDLPPVNDGIGSGSDEEAVRVSREEGKAANEDNEFDRGTQIDSGCVSTQGEFLDANEEFSEDSSSSGFASPSSSFSNNGLALHSTRLCILEEIHRRKVAEETVMLMQFQWRRIQSLFSEAGLTFPPPPTASESSIIEFDQSCINQSLQEFVFSIFISEAIGKGLARAEAEEHFASIILWKDQEMQRLRDRLQYLETVNHEMSQRKLVEVAQKQQEKKKKNRRRWMWSLMGFSVAAGASFLAYAYHTTSKSSPLDMSSDSASQQH